MNAQQKSQDTLLSLKAVHFRVDDQTILRDISFDILPRQITTIIGPNGAGKSTLIKMVAGLLRPSQGKLSSQSGLTLGYVPQKIALNKSMPIKVSRFMSLSGASKFNQDEALERLAINHLKRAQVHDLSGGEFQRVLLARAISRKPNLILLDEPLQGIDINGQVELYRFIADLRSSLPCSVLMVSHDLHLVMAQTDNVICLNQHICCHGKPESVSQHPEYSKLFGEADMKNIALYTHHHDHHHTLDGDTVDCGEECNHD